MNPRTLSLDSALHLVAVDVHCAHKKTTPGHFSEFGVTQVGPYASLDFNNFWQECLVQSRQLKDGVISHVT